MSKDKHRARDRRLALCQEAVPIVGRENDYILYSGLTLSRQYCRPLTDKLVLECIDKGLLKIVRLGATTRSKTTKAYLTKKGYQFLSEHEGFEVKQLRNNYSDQWGGKSYTPSNTIRIRAVEFCEM